VKQKIEQLSKGIFEYQLPDIILSEEKIERTVAAGRTHRGTFIISNSKGSRMKGVLYSSSRLLTLENDKFIGEENEISYEFSAEYMNNGDVITGEISIISDCGETLLPFAITIEPPFCESSMGVIKDLFQFTNLAKSDWLEAKNLFLSDDFSKALTFYDDKFSLLYRHLVSSRSDDRALEEFLVAIHKKLPITIEIDKLELTYEAGQYSFLDKLILTKNTWGYTEIDFSTDADFISLEHKKITSDNFMGMTCEVGFVILPEHMRNGNNFGVIRLESVFATIEIPISCHRTGKAAPGREKHKKQRQFEEKLIKNYLNFRMNKVAAGRYAAEAGNILFGLENQASPSVLYDLYHIHLLMATGKDTQAKAALLVHEKELAVYEKNQPLLFAAVLYLNAMLQKQPLVSAQVCETLRSYYASHSSEWMILWFLLYLDKKYEYAKQQKLQDIREQFDQGCKSPVLYYEAAFLMNENPSIIKELHDFEIQIINFSFKYGYLSKDVAMQFTYLAGKEKKFHPLVFRLLAKIYVKWQEKEVLTAICSLLIRGAKSGTDYFEWFHLGVMQQVNISEVYEYYLSSIGEYDDTALASHVLKYFTMHHELTDRRKAFLYANLIRHKNEEPTIYESYKEHIETFAIEQLSFGIINRNTAEIYNEVLPNLLLTDKLARLIPDIAFYYELECENKNMKEVCVVHKEIMEEVFSPIVEKKAYISIYTENAEVFLVDDAGNRYIATINYTLKKLIHLEKLLSHCFEVSGEHPKLLLHLAEKVQYYQKFDAAGIELRKRVSRLPGLNPYYSRSYLQTLIYYYYENYEGDLLEMYLMQVDLATAERSERIKLIEFMIIRDLYNVALKGMAEFGFEGIDSKRLVKLCSRLIMNEGGMEKIDVLVDICHYVFKAGKFDDVILKYLIDYFYGTTSDMYDIWKAAKTFELDTLDLEERLLGQMLFAESYIGNAKAVFGSYYRSGVNRKLIRAFLSYYAYKYLLKDRPLEPELFDIMRRESNYEENEVCLLAILKMYSTREQLTDAEVNFIDYQLHRLEQKGVILPFFKEFKNSMKIPQKIYDKFFVEYRTDPECHVEIHYSFEDGSKCSSFTTEEMKNVCYGIFVKEFVLFCNESLQYYITERCCDDENITESTEIRLSPEQTGGEDTKYYQLNMILTAKEMQDEKTALKLLETYVKNEYAISQLFHPL